ncbi:A24 family peptidase [Streptomyces sp. NBC_01591]|uniref:A24 family peptidase n=1 Tax=Streptomyces sp. NBC_01591 TaxID=2975888 RepID=UPI002DDB4992|nr:A24 family peptidase [Streptomyces sp. NBC_01591]WSD70525.1 A24 family peptidase [Streptomyces sp. NBC_01591]
MDAMLTVLAALWGAAAGLLVPRAAYRFSVEPEDPWRDACPEGHALTGAARGWLGSTRCAQCAAVPVSATTGDGPGDPGDGTDSPRHATRYAPGVLVPVVTALSCAVLGAATGLRPELAVWLLLAPVAVLLATIDRRVHRLPDRLTLPAAGAIAVLLGAAALLPEHGGSWLSALLGGAALGGFYFLLFLINPNGMGFGDVKLALSLGMALGWYGWAVVFVGGFAGFLLGAAYGFGLMVLKRAGRKTGIPFGPFMITGALLGILLGALAA